MLTLCAWVSQDYSAETTRNLHLFGLWDSTSLETKFRREKEEKRKEREKSGQCSTFSLGDRKLFVRKVVYFEGRIPSLCSGVKLA